MKRGLKEKELLPTVPYQVFLSRHRIAVLCGSLNVILVLASFVTFYFMAREFARTQRVISIQGSTVINSGAEDIMNAHDVHVLEAKQAAIALLNRGPNGWDLKQSLQRRFIGEAKQKAIALFETEAREFALKELHQKAEIKSIEVLQIRNPAILVSLKGQLVRTGWFPRDIPLTEPFSEPMDFMLKLKMRFNRKMMENGLFPLVVYDFEYVSSQPIQL